LILVTLNIRKEKDVTVYDLKPRFQALLRPLSNRLVALGSTPNQITIAAILLSIGEGVLILAFPGKAFPLLLLPVVLFVRMALNAIDGMMAKEHNMQTQIGQQLNEYGDIVSDLALYAPFYSIFTLDNAKNLLVVFLLGLVLSEVVGIAGNALRGVRRYDGPMGKSDRAFAMGVLAVVLAIWGENPLYAQAYMIVLVGLVCITVARRYSKTFDGGTR
jgi:CDP-diacylglycerol--glycerol-3-phosphate 3-phosphatidyltransferase